MKSVVSRFQGCPFFTIEAEDGGHPPARDRTYNPRHNQPASTREPPVESISVSEKVLEAGDDL
jgi:hypothetical protein